MPNRALKILDIGCGNHSPSITKSWFRDCEYTGVDVAEYELDDRDRALIDNFIFVSPSGEGYNKIRDQYFDFVIVNHVIEHMKEPYPIVSRLLDKLRPGGIIWIAFPSLHSLSLQSAVGTLHFCDDETHVRVIEMTKLANAVLDGNCKIIFAGRSKDALRFLIGLALYPIALFSKVLTGRMKARGLWYFCGFEDCLLAQKRL